MENTEGKSLKNSFGQTGEKVRTWWRRTTGAPMKTHEKIIGIVLIVVFLCAFYLTLDANKYRALVHVIEGEGKVGVNPTTEALDFGDLSPGTSAVRKVSIANGTPMPMYIMVFKLGGVSELMKIDRNFFKLPARGDAQIEFTVYMPASAKINADYKGRVFLFKVPTLGL